MNRSNQTHNTKTTELSFMKPGAVPMLNSDELFKGAREVKLFHHCEEYRLRITRNEKLILTK